MSIVIPGKLLSSDRSAWDFGALVLSDHTIESRIPLQDAPKDDDTIILDSEECYLFPGYVSLMESLSEGCPLPQTQSNTSSTSALGALRAFLSMRREKKVQQLYAGNVQKALFAGKTCICTVYGIEDYDTSIRDAIAAEEIPGPQILASNMAITMPEDPHSPSVCYKVKDAEEIAARVRKVARDDPDFIYIVAEYQGEHGFQMPKDMLRRGITTAHNLGYPVMVKAHSDDYLALLHILEADFIYPEQEGKSPWSNAAVLGMQDYMGDLQEGTLANLIAVTKNPLDNQGRVLSPEDLAPYIKYVVKEGAVYEPNA
jgi:hypothetical protein